MTNNPYYSIVAYLLCLLFTVSCTHTDTPQQTRGGLTLADIDINHQDLAGPTKTTPIKNQEEIRNAYRKYVENASSDDISRQKALTRLAQLELAISDSLIEDEEDAQAALPQVDQSLRRTISLLETTLNDYPEAKGNDKVLYQLAEAYDRAGQYRQSLTTLERLSAKYPQSLYYPEAQFRLGEAAFASGDYIRSEDAYTEVILTPGSEKYYEKSLFKRGWTRFKQQIYDEAIDDYVLAMDYHGFSTNSELSDATKTQFDEYVRALALAFSYHGVDGYLQRYFEQNPEFPFVFDIYSVLSDIFLQQERFSDGARVLEEYTRIDNTSPHNVAAELKIISSWKKGNFTSKLFQSIEGFYQRYNPDANYWQQVDDEGSKTLAVEQLRHYMVEVSAYHHENYNKRKKKQEFNQAKRWYDRYLNHFDGYANKDNIHTLYGELLLSANKKRLAFDHFYRAAFDGDIILDKRAAYATVVLSDDFLNAGAASEKEKWVDTHLQAAQRFVELYPNDTRSPNIATRAAEHAFNANKFQSVINVANYVPETSDKKSRFNTNNLKARAFLALEQYSDAEAVYTGLATSQFSKRTTAKQIQDSLALSIYRQGEAAQLNQQVDNALHHFTRIARIAPSSQLAPTGLYDAIALAMEKKRWNDAIGLSETFKNNYTNHKNMADVTKKLSIAYLNSDQKGKAAQEFERIAKFEGNAEVQMAALWQAAQLYESKNKIDASIRAYKQYAHNYPTPFEPHMEAMYKLTELYQTLGDKQKRYFWQAKIRRADQNVAPQSKTDRTTYIASTTTLDLARQKKQEFSQRKLVEPIARNLKLKKTAMQDSVKLFGQASAYGIQNITTEATFSIGKIYQEFSESLLSSERPSNLNSEELEQYEILLEDQAFPFEEKAIEFYEINLARSQDNIFDGWLDKSFHQLNELFPVRYNRSGKADVYTHEQL